MAYIEGTVQDCSITNVAISHNVPFRTEICTFLFWMLQCGISTQWRCCSFALNHWYHSILVTTGLDLKLCPTLWDRWKFRTCHTSELSHRTGTNFIFICIIIPPTQQSCWGVYWFYSVCPSVCPSVRPASRVRSVAPTVLVGSISYLHILSSNFRRCVAGNFWQFYKICNFDFVLLWLWIWWESLLWVIMRQWGVSQIAGVLVVLVCIEFHQ